MARRGLFAEMQYQLCEAERARQRQVLQQQRAVVQAQRERERAARVAQRQARQVARTEQARRIEQHKDEAAWRTEGVRARADELAGLLAEHAAVPRLFTVEQLRQRFEPSPHTPDPQLVTAATAPSWSQFAPPEPTMMQRVFRSGWQQLAEARRHEYDQAVTQYEQYEQARTAALAEDLRRHEDAERTRYLEAEQYNAAIDELAGKVAAGDAEAMEQVAVAFLTATPLPERVPSDTDVVYQSAAQRLLVVRRLPDITVIPAEREFRYVRARDEIAATARPTKEIRQRYAELIAQLVLLVIRDAFALQPTVLIDEVGVSAIVAGKNAATGQPEDQCLISVSVNREQFERLVLTDLEPVACLRYLNALISPHPWDYEPIRPIFDPDLSKYRIDSADAVSGVDHRTVLTKMQPKEFEDLIRELFEARGMESWVTQASKDDGVDAVVVNRDPVTGGECIIQAKRYSKVVEIDSVRALAGVMEDKRASRGILVTTSYLGKASHEFARRHGRIQLIEGPELKHLIAEHLGLDVVIGPIKSAPRRWSTASGE